MREYTKAEKMLMQACEEDNIEEVRRIINNYTYKVNTLTILELTKELQERESEIADIFLQGVMHHIYSGYIAEEYDFNTYFVVKCALYLQGAGYSKVEDVLDRISEKRFTYPAKELVLKSATETQDPVWILLVSEKLDIPISDELLDLCPYEVHETKGFPSTFYRVILNPDLRVVKKYYEMTDNVDEYQLGRLWASHRCVYNYFTSILELPNEGQTFATTLLEFSDMQERNLLDHVNAWDLNSHVKDPDLFQYVLRVCAREDIEMHKFQNEELLLFVDQAPHLAKYFKERSSDLFFHQFVDCIIGCVSCLTEQHQKSLKIILQDNAHRIPYQTRVKFIVELFEKNPCRDCLEALPTLEYMYDVDVYDETSSPSPKSPKTEEDLCPITWVNITNNYAQTRCCNQKFSPDSLFKWLKSHRTCPYCRTEIFIGPNHRRWKQDHEKAFEEVRDILGSLDGMVCESIEEWQDACKKLYDLLGNGDKLEYDIQKDFSDTNFCTDMGELFQTTIMTLNDNGHFDAIDTILSKIPFVKNEFYDAILFHSYKLQDDIEHLRHIFKFFLKKEYGSLPDDIKEKIDSMDLPRIENLHREDAVYFTIPRIFLDLDNEEPDE